MPSIFCIEVCSLLHTSLLDEPRRPARVFGSEGLQIARLCHHMIHGTDPIAGADAKRPLDAHLHDAINKWAALSKMACKPKTPLSTGGSMTCVSNNSKADDDISPQIDRYVFTYVNDEAPARLLLHSRTVTQMRSSMASMRSTTSTESSIRSLFALADDSNPSRDQVRRLIVLQNGYPFLNPRATYRSLWDVLVAIAVIYFTLFTPLRLSLTTTAPPGYATTTFMMSIIYILNIAVNFMTGYEGIEGIVFSYSVIARQYIRAWLLIDLMTIFPYEHVFTFNSTPMHTSSIAMFWRWQNIAVLRMACVARMNEISNRLLWRLSHATFQFLKMIFIVLIGIHLSSCLWMYMAVNGDPDEGTWLNNSYHINAGVSMMDLSAASWSDFYISCLYFAITITSGVGYGDYYAITLLEKVFAIISMSSSSSLIAFLISEISSLFLKIDISDAEFRNKLELVGNFLRKKKIPPDLISRIEGQYRFYYLHLGVTSFTGYSQILNGLSPALILEVQMFLNKTIISNVPFLNGIGDSFLRNLLKNITSQVWAKGDCIIHHGEVGYEMYFIRRGKVKAVDSTGRTLTTLEAGQYFGELALLLTLRRTASVIAVTNCELFCLSKASFDSILRDFPEALHSMRQYAIQATYKFEKEKHGVLREKWTQLSAQMQYHEMPGQTGSMSVDDPMHLNLAVEDAAKKKYQLTRSLQMSDSSEFDDELLSSRLVSKISK